MLPNRVHISKRSTEILKLIKTRTGVTPNILCRIALTLSLEEGHQPNPDTTDLDGAEFNITTLLGDAALLYDCLLKQAHGELPPKQAQLFLAGHIDNGVDKLKRAKNVGNLIQ